MTATGTAGWVTGVSMVIQSHSGYLPEGDISIDIRASWHLFRLSLFLEVMFCPAGNFPALLQRESFSALTRRKLKQSLPEQPSWPYGILITLVVSLPCSIEPFRCSYLMWRRKHICRQPGAGSRSSFTVWGSGYQPWYRRPYLESLAGLGSTSIVSREGL